METFTPLESARLDEQQAMPRGGLLGLDKALEANVPQRCKSGLEAAVQAEK